MQELHNFADVHTVLGTFLSTPRRYSAARFSLDEMKRLLEFLGNPQDKLKVVHVAGTSGKTSTSYYIAALLRAAGKKVGLTVSPHVDEINERVQINLKPLSEKKFCNEFAMFLRLIGKSKIKPSYKAVLVAFAYWVFAREKVDYAVVEVGMGGVLDPTNTINRADKVCVITDIGFDHTEYLGNTLSAITSQKAGIIHPHNATFTYEQGEETMAVLQEVCEQQQAELHEVWPLGNAELPKNLPLFQRRNWYLALCVFQFVAERDQLQSLSEADLAATTDTYIPARMEMVPYGHKVIVLDGAHNAQKLEALGKSIAAKYHGKKIAMLFSTTQTKGRRTRSNMTAVTALADHIIFTSFELPPDVPKYPANPKKMAEYAHMQGFDEWEIVSDPKKAFTALKKRPEEVLLVAGSFYLLNHIRPLVRALSK